jgi:hypothetical protein
MLSSNKFSSEMRGMKNMGKAEHEKELLLFWIGLGSSIEAYSKIKLTEICVSQVFFKKR